MSPDRTPLVGDPRSGAILGIMLTVAGAFLLWDAYEGRGNHRPFALRIFSGLT